MLTSALLIIDVQKGFINDHTAHIPGRVEAVQEDFTTVYASRFFNVPGSMHRRILGWERFACGTEDTELAFKPRKGTELFDKTTYTAMTPDFIAILQRNPVERLVLCGIATDNCILKTALDVFEAGIEAVVLAADCASHGGAAYHAAGLLVLRRMIGADHVVDDHTPFIDRAAP